MNLINDIIYTSMLITNPITTNIENFSSIIILLWLDNLYNSINLNLFFLLNQWSNTNFLFIKKPLIFSFFFKFIKIYLLFLSIFIIFFLNNFFNYINQLKKVNNTVRLFITNESEKEVGPVDDFFFFAVLFLLTLVSFVFTSFFVIIFSGKIFIWSMGSLLLLAVLILSIPLNLFIDFGIAFFVYIRGSTGTGNFIKELVFDIISTFTVFIRFVIQNIRFLFIFSAIFELLEWTFSLNSSLFLTNQYFNNNIFVNYSNINYFNLTNSSNLVIINSIMFVILYFYYTLHLLFLLLVQITIYIGISVWLFFFLYSTKFLSKYEKFFTIKK